MILAAVAVVASALDAPLPPVAGTARVSDGDSFVLGGDRIRLLGLDAPELSQHCRDAKGDDWPCGRAARDRLAGLLARGPVQCRPEDKDQYGRILATCTVSGADLGAAMVGEGLAIAAGDYWREEAAAREEGRGIWVGGFEVPRTWRDDHPRPHNVFGWLLDIWQ